MKKLTVKGRLPLVIGGGVAVAALAAVGVFFRHLIPYLLIALLVVGVIWIAAHFLVLLLRRRRQRSFDAGVAAKEGIDDRRREWASWTDELNRQGIDRYELPFYLLVGEPQSGKSVLLQNSELHFPFGQTRLSGVGGTRGCDWWFTEEAVILDLAGRLFTHEGGASDALEWEAFLELLSEFRPLCPANGVMLVIPCDSLLVDSRDEATRKASRMQEAMLTLTSKLQAQLPIYVILTKGDRVFGFAETVHRLDSEKRQQMFGWSRRAEDFEQPFDIVEVRDAFGDMVGRARLLRETMLSTLRLPEGLPEADRVYALPDELEALLPNLEVYLKRIFSESTLVDRLYFRGFYLTSGLQVGAPIAKVCSKLLGSEGDADKRSLEALFSKQQAYFIKDLVRRRVFSERGLVRPTKKRVTRAHRSAWIGYGTAATIALVSVIWSATYVLGDYQKPELSAFATAIDKGRAVAAEQDPTAESVVAAADAAWAAREIEPRSIEELGANRQKSFEQLFLRLCDAKLVPSLRRRAERDLLTSLSDERTQPRDHEAYLRRVGQAQLLLQSWSPLQTAPLLAGKPREEVAEAQDLVAVLADPVLVESAAKLLATRKTLPGEVPASAPRRSGGQLDGELKDAVAWLEGQWDRALTFGDPLQLHGHVGCLVAWQHAMEAREQLATLTATTPSAADDPKVAAASAQLAGATEYLRSSTAKRNALVALPDGGLALDEARLRTELNDLAATRDALAAARLGTAQEAPSEWGRHRQLVRFLETQLARRKSEGSSTDVGAQEGRLLVNADLVAPSLVFTVAADTYLPAGSAAPPRLPDTIRAALAAVAPEGQPGVQAPDLALAQGLFRAKLRQIYDGYVATYPGHQELASALSGSPGGALDRPRLLGVLAHLVELHQRLGEVGASGYVGDWQAHLQKLAAGTLGALDAVVVGPDDDALDAELLAALTLVHGQFMDNQLRDRVSALTSKHAEGVTDNVLAGLQHLPRSGTGTEQLLARIDQHLSTVTQPVPFAPDRALLGAERMDPWCAACTALVGEHLAHHVDSVRSKCTLPIIPGASALAADIERRLIEKMLVDWQSSCDLPDLERSAVVAARTALAERTPTKDLCAAVDEFAARWARVTATGEIARREALAQLTEALSVDSGKPPLTGAQVATAFAKHIEDRKTIRDTPSASAVEHYLEELTRHLESGCVATLRELYIRDLIAIVDRRRELKRALYLSTPELPDLDRQQRLIAADLARLLDPDGDFAKLQASYRQGGDSEVDFRPAGDSAQEPSAEWWAFDVFLRELRAFLAGDDVQAKVSASTIDIWLEPSIERLGAWTRPQLFTNFESGNPDNRVNAGTVRRMGPLAWGFDEQVETSIWMRWSKSSSRELEDDIKVEVKSCLAPLLLAWISDAPDDERRRWDVTATPASTTEEVRFVLEFARPLPARPARPW